MTGIGPTAIGISTPIGYATVGAVSPIKRTTRSAVRAWSRANVVPVAAGPTASPQILA